MDRLGRIRTCGPRERFLASLTLKPLGHETGTSFGGTAYRVELQQSLRPTETGLYPMQPVSAT